VDTSKIGGDDKLDTFCDAVYRMYRSRDEQYHPDSGYAKEFKARFSHARGRPPVKFLGLLDTVGALGVPNINPGVGLSYEFYDQNVSAEVANVYQALSVHDRLSVFEPCFVRRKAASKELVTEEVWFPGAHYDIGRQRFVFPRATGNLVERATHAVNDAFNVLMTNIEPTLECSAAVLDWMLARIAATEADVTMLLDPAGALRRCRELPWEDYVPHLPALNKNAYDVLLDRFKPAGILHPFSEVILRDRDIPAYRVEAFYVRPDGSDADEQLLSRVSGFKSQSYDAYRCLRPSAAGVQYVRGPSWGPSQGPNGGKASAGPRARVMAA
jgi:hypothetical protein